MVLLIAPCSVLYSLSFVLWALAWYYMMTKIEDNTKFSEIYRVYSRSQIGKYLPGNVFHYVGRQFIGKSVGLKHDVVLTVTTCEILFQVFASIIIAVAGFPALTVNPLHKVIIFVLGGATITMIALGPFLMNQLIKRFAQASTYVQKVSLFSPKSQVRFFFVPLIAYMLSFLMIGGLICVVSSVVYLSECSLNHMLKFGSIYAIAWTLGLVTPGSPGGIGVRDAVLTVQLSPLIGASHALTLALGLRAAAVLGDVLFYLTSFLSQFRKSGSTG